MIESRTSASVAPPAHFIKTMETHSGITTSWLPIITSPPIDPRCGGHLYNPDGEYRTLIAFDPRMDPNANMTCLPPEATEWYTQKNLPFGATTGTVTSLGPMICPCAYTTASTSKKDESSTMVYCCPSNYDFATPADHGLLYGCTSQQTQAVTVHFPASNPPASSTIGTLVPGLPSRAPIVAGIAINGWIFNSSSYPTLSSPSPTSTFTADVWAKQHLGMTTAAFAGIIVGAIAVISLFMWTLCFCVRRKYFRPRPDPQPQRADNNASKSETDEQVAIRGAAANDSNSSMRSPSRSDVSRGRSLVREADLEMQDLDPMTGGSRAPSTAHTVVRHSTEPSNTQTQPRSEHSVSKNEGSSEEMERTA